ncbi:hypothetical protein KAM644c_03720 [Klebsiella quasipneumoniae subsp. quasipneumoniae]|uniref:Uncharacterized protein n=1 Tax=Klebsiella quasipneumoniae subsp. quasipneumoniae TaxID=1667327 RepID=A0AAN1Y0T0_9ENTR|nr:hypothetical protein TMSI_03720 [Klebsiella quasipneumoniae]BDO00789.1 hypothetical protein KAM622c_03760 [Klebsiella quasipneumoniae subsp. quasipneumoniae]BDO11306.1 hypothetical protein KAM644c_03720 [Klebsiella quasipneumoniae subsp. quasipneumoniae]BDO17282.1 hypothetical protein KAM645c_03720 [Klebsiella quasipneumoniae subsp. quasipneumoniae]GKO48021.1 hypothetical protein NUBL21974_31000 [Klebsiella quasipneumoniae]
MLKRDTRRHAAKAMLKQSGCYSNTLMYCMYAEEFTLQAVEKSSASFPGIGKQYDCMPGRRVVSAPGDSL